MRHTAAKATDPVVEIHGLHHHGPDGQRLFAEAELALFPGERVAIRGPEAGTIHALLLLLTGLASPAQGEIRLFGEALGRLGRRDVYALRRRIGVVFSRNPLVSNLRAVENVALPLMYHEQLSRAAALARARDLLEAAGFVDGLWALPDHLSPAPRKLVALARALVLRPEILAWEEPADGFDAEVLRRLWKLVDQSLPEHALLLVTLRQPATAPLPADRVITIASGRFVETSASVAPGR